MSSQTNIVKTNPIFLLAMPHRMRIDRPKPRAKGDRTSSKWEEKQFKIARIFLVWGEVKTPQPAGIKPNWGSNVLVRI